MGRSDQYLSGYRAASKRATSLVHEQAALMNDPHAKQLLNVMAFELGLLLKRDYLKMAGITPDEDGNQ